MAAMLPDPGGARALRVLHVASAASAFPRFRWQMLQAQRTRGHEVEVACRDQPEYVAQIRAGGFPVHVVDLPRRVHPVRTARGFAQLVRLMRRGGFDAVHVHQPMGALVGIPAARVAGVRAVFYTTGGLKAHEGMRPAVRRLVTAVERVLCGRVTAVFSVNRDDVKHAVGAGVVAPDRIHHVGARGGCGIDTARFHPPAPEARRRTREALGVTPDEVVVGIVARAVWEKGYRELVDAVALLPPGLPVHLVAAGGGADAEAIATHVAARGVGSRVTLLGDRGDVPALLGAMDVFVLPSYREGMPVSLLEAMATGLPVVASRVRGSREVVDDGRNGLLVPVRDAAALADALARLAGDAELRARMGRAGEAAVRAEHAEAVVLPRFMELYECLVARACRPDAR